MNELLTVATLAWVAGVLDAFGGVRVRKVEQTDLPMVYVHGGSNLTVMQRLADLTGTRVTRVNRDYTRFGCAEHCPEQHQHIRSETGRWSVTGVKATVLLWNVIPYLEALEDEANEVLLIGLNAPRKAATLGKMEALGWTLPDQWIGQEAG